MPQTIAGIDIGTHSIKIVLLHATLRGYEFIRFIDHPLIPAGPRVREAAEEEEARKGADEPTPEARAGADEATIVGALAQALAEAEVKPDRVICSLAPGQFSSRTLALPFNQKKKIDQTIAFEIESQVPFNLEEMLLDYQILRTAESETQVMAILAPKTALESRLRIFEAVGLDPYIVDVAPMALFNAAREVSESSGGNLVLLDIGCSQSSLCVFQDGTILQARTIPIAGDQITKAIARDFEVSEEEAEALKVDQSYIEIDPDELIPAEARRLSDTIKEALAPLVSEIRRSLSACFPDGERWVDRIQLTGGTSKIKNLPHYLSAALDTEVTRLKVPFEVSSALTRPAEEEAIVPHSFGLALRGADEKKGSQINLRCGDFTFKGVRNDVRSQMIRIGAMAAVLLVLFSFRLYRAYDSHSSRYDEITTKIDQAFTKAFPELKNIRNEKQRISTAKTKVSEIKAQVSLLGGISGDRLTVLDALKEISERVGPEIVVDVKELNIDGEKIRLQGETSSFESVDQIKGNLAKCDGFREVDVTDAKLSVDQTRVKFNINILLKG